MSYRVYFVALLSLACAALSSGCSDSTPTTCEVGRCSADCALLGFSSGVCGGGACQCLSGPGDADADGDEDGEGDLDGEEACAVVLPWCEPERAAPCPEDTFCCAGAAERRRCEGREPVISGDEGWSCRVQQRDIVCEGSQFPDHAVGFSCEEVLEGEVTCIRKLFLPDEGADKDWSCSIEGAVTLVCLAEEPPPPPEGCCVPGASRTCDTPTYCSWGRQSCNPDGLSWGSCEELPAVPVGCEAVAAWYSPDAEECCIAQGGCCQDMWDLDLDGETWESLGDCSDVTCG